MKKWQAFLGAAAISALGLQGFLGSVPAHAAQLHKPPSAQSQAVASIARMLRSNADVSYRRPETITAPMRDVAGPAAITQSAIDRFNLRNKVTTQLVHLQIDSVPVWHNADDYMIYANLTYNERLAKTHRLLRDVRWDYLFVTRKEPSAGFRVTDVMPVTVIRYQSMDPRFDYAPVVDYPSMSSAFRGALIQSQKQAHYASSRLTLTMFGYDNVRAHHALQVFLFAHNGLSVPLYAVSGQLTARLHGVRLFRGDFTLSEKSFGILFPGQTRFTVVTLPESDIAHMKDLQAYSLATTFSTQFTYRPL
ncbi:MAG: hypothetical protein OWT28_00550 [Firmicutes bacterium]|nr:hypothetical protein [Bacillota bacterium]